MNIEDIRNVVVVGAGTMGPGIAATFARSGYETTLCDVEASQIEKARGVVDFVFATWTTGGLAAGEDIDAARRRLSFAVDASAALGQADVVLENAPERLELKRSIFATLAQSTRDTTILASDTSGIPISSLQQGIANPGRVVGMHWSNPPHLIPVIEVIRGRETTQATLDAVVALAKRLNMLPAVVDRDVPGFVENRILYAIMREALHLLDQGVASAEAIDTIVRWGIGYKLGVVGPLRLLDMAGLDIYTSVASYLNRDLCNDTGVSATVTSKVAEGKLGLKTQAGLFAYTREEIEALARERARLLVASGKALGR